MLANKKLSGLTNLFSPYDFDKNDQIDKKKLIDQTKLRFYEIKNIENYFINEINERKSYSKKLNKFVIIFYYI